MARKRIIEPVEGSPAAHDRYEAVVEALVERWLADCPPLSEDRKLRLSRLVTPPNSVRSSTATGRAVGDGGGPRAA